MSRDIEFRAWDVFNDVFYYSDHYKNLAEFFAVVQKCIDGGNHIVFEQYTGRKDKSGAKIFEGDFVSQLKNCLFDDGSVIRQVSFRCDQFVSGECSLCQAVESFQVEVIGNIHEHPTLLEQV